MLTTFLASAFEGVRRFETPSATTNTRSESKQSRIGRAMDFSCSCRRTWSERDVSPGRSREEFEGHHVERDSNIPASIESVRDGSWWVRRARAAPGIADPASRMADKIYRRLAGYNPVNTCSRAAEKALD